jgi:L-ribulose-5-phosphate 3-epimerase
MMLRMIPMQNRRRFCQLATAALAMKALAGAKPAMQLGLILGAGKDPEAAIRKVHDLAFPRARWALAPSSRKWRSACALLWTITGSKPPRWYPAAPIRKSTISTKVRRPSAWRRAPSAKRASRKFAKLRISPSSPACPLCRHIAVSSPEDPNDPIYKETVDAIRTVAAHCRRNGQHSRCETGQETPIALFRAIRDVGLDNVGVNFDAANLILYGKADRWGKASMRRTASIPPIRANWGAKFPLGTARPTFRHSSSG